MRNAVMIRAAPRTPLYFPSGTRAISHSAIANCLACVTENLPPGRLGDVNPKLNSGFWFFRLMSFTFRGFAL
jgi:hypothetical protein